MSNKSRFLRINLSAYFIIANHEWVKPVFFSWALIKTVHVVYYLPAFFTLFITLFEFVSLTYFNSQHILPISCLIYKVQEPFILRRSLILKRLQSVSHFKPKEILVFCSVNELFSTLLTGQI